MNLLAHLHLSERRPVAKAAGNLLADYLRRLHAVPLDEHFAAGVRLHRAIDAFADAHPALRAVRASLAPPWRRWGGILLDVACDFFLSREWPRFSPLPLSEYVADRLGGIQAYLLPHATPLRPLLDRAIAEEWLLAYGSPHGLRLTFERISHRSPAAAALRGAEREILRLQPTLHAAFTDAYPHLLSRFSLAFSPPGEFNHAIVHPPHPENP